jgi:ATP-dependent helicase/nuclease subunit B
MAFSIYTIAPESRFLTELAHAVLEGFPTGATDLPLSRWTILVPNRRSARALESILLLANGSKPLLLPTIKPIGDIDEDMIADSLPAEGVPDAISKTDHLHAILSLLTTWAENHPELELADDILNSGAQAFALAQSLQQLVNQFETEDGDVALLKDLGALDLAGHRQNILDLLAVVTKDLPLKLQQAGVLGPAARRNLMIRLEASRITARHYKGPIIAAGSTGTNPATRDLLKAIATAPMGAVVLPGLDQALDEAGWNAITPEHPQFALKTMLSQWGVDRSTVAILGQSESRRPWLLSQALRPSAVADQWMTILKAAAPEVTHALQHVELVEADDRQHEAEIIALRLRQHVHQSKAKAALITPDRDLATRVKAALQRWNLEIDDSAGEPLLHTGLAALTFLLLRTVEQGFSTPSLFALLYHQNCRFNQSRMHHLEAVRALELIAFRGLPETAGLSHIKTRITARKHNLKSNPYEHPLLLNLSDEAWAAAEHLADTLVATLHAFVIPLSQSLAEHIEQLVLALDALAPPEDQRSTADQLTRDVLEALQQGSLWHPVDTLARTQHSILHALARETLRAPLQEDSQLSLYGLAEARLIDVELAILGGLVDGAWPDRPESGPWLNRPMRDSLKLQQPEREIGVTAHDFVQGFCQPSVMVTWPKRLQNQPVIASRWVLRLEAVLETAGLKREAYLSKTLATLARQLDAPRLFKPVSRPQARPPLASRPTQFSVTRVEKLVRDSYWIYARHCLKLLPLQAMGQDLDAALRGSLIHGALHSWAEALPQVPPADRLKLLLAKGEQQFQPFIAMPEVQRFWWPRFKTMAAEFIEKDESRHLYATKIFTERDGKITFDVAGVAHSLTARADRIDITAAGSVRIMDYKSGDVPTDKEIKSGFSPQLTLEAAMVTRGGFAGLNATTVSEVLYMSVGGSALGLKVTALSSVSEEAEKAYAKLHALLLAFQNPKTAYIPRHNLQKDEEVSDYDHLSRRLEWQLQGKAL